MLDENFIGYAAFVVLIFVVLIVIEALQYDRGELIDNAKMALRAVGIGAISFGAGLIPACLLRMLLKAFGVYHDFLPEFWNVMIWLFESAGFFFLLIITPVVFIIIIIPTAINMFRYFLCWLMNVPVSNDWRPIVMLDIQISEMVKSIFNIDIARVILILGMMIGGVFAGLSTK